MSESLSGRVAVVTGAASGIGAATARLLAGRGARVALLARREERLEALAAEITGAGGTALAVPVDVTDAAALAVAADRVAALGTVDLLVAGAGTMLTAPFELGRTEQWQRMIDTNLTGLVHTIHVFEPQLARAARSGGPADVFTVSSIAAQISAPNFALYCATKAAVSHLSRNLRTEFGPRGIRVTALEPGVVETELMDHLDDPSAQAWLDGLRRSIEVLTDADIAGIVAHAAALPRHVNLSQIVVLPTAQV
ncbi:SDR family oxidoreductase [Kitasatospora sp. DSM 101779]|jgi:NADP-dependent 3-hydroxy acid dehydrogenase YdfG|uniref:SDR family oxidoreductase n=1 Tax=Kitasatospora sp. DSM 101779 TaxID=2853165 RepID=UPI0021DA1EFA|nr:SDR family oxidoreductase [Kitasatospora sp. DSM 101779]MCU7821882.1 SDR family oxidoreductase [Kitasatospora sp. DSM 101779]